VINPVAMWVEWLDSRQAIADLTAERDAARAERDAAILRAAAAEGNYKFHLGLTCEADERRKAQVTHGR
jgi:hypothetical protein